MDKSNNGSVVRSGDNVWMPWRVIEVGQPDEDGFVTLQLGHSECPANTTTITIRAAWLVIFAKPDLETARP